eukprot:764295-Hanusia_phi.AAC.9
MIGVPESSWALSDLSDCDSCLVTPAERPGPPASAGLPGPAKFKPGFETQFESYSTVPLRLSRKPGSTTVPWLSRWPGGCQAEAFDPSQ